MKKRLIALFLAAIMLLCASCSQETTSGSALRDKAQQIGQMAQEANDALEALEALAIDRSDHVPYASLSHTDIMAEDMEYYIYDSTLFLEKCDQLAACEDVYEAIDLYNWLYNEYIIVESQYSICYIIYCRDVSNQQAQDDQIECEKVANGCWDSFCAAVRDCLAGPVGNDFAIFLGEDEADAYREYENMSTREEELNEEETRLIALYYEELEREDEVTFYYNGKDWTMEMLYGSAGSRLNYNDWYNVYFGIQGEVNKILGEIFLQLVAVRDEKAELAGYDSYADYAYENVYGRDYTPDDAQMLCDIVKDGIGARFYDCLYNSDLLYSDYSYDASAEEMLEITGSYCYMLDERLGEAWDYLMRNELYYISDSPDMLQGGFTTSVSMYNAPYIHIALSGQIQDLGTVIHEFGHFCDAYWNQQKDVFLDGGSYDIFEIHSNGLEMMMMRYYPEILGSRAVPAEFYSLLETVYSVVDGCLYNEFQRIIYDNPDMTLDEINQLYYDLCIEYGEQESYGVDYYWMYVHHNFDAPMYYVSYAVSALSALELWDMQQDDPDAALEKYMEILGLGAYDYGYTELIEMVGMTPFYAEGAAARICFRVIEYMHELD